MAGPIPTVEMLREEYQVHFGATLADEGAETAGGPISHERLKASLATKGLALSGGGIRSATFSLGVLQALAASRLLTSFDYLSTVSGGGYIGSWLTAWAHRHPAGISGVMEDLVPRADRGDHEAAPIAHLRRYSNYLTPRVGLLSSDTWTIIGTYLRNLLVNWLSLVPYFALLLLVPIIGVHALQAAAESGWIRSIVGESAFTGGHVLALASILCLVMTMAVLGISLPSSTIPGSDKSRIALVARNQEEFLLKAMVPLILGGIGLAMAWFTQTKPIPGASTLHLPDFFPRIGLSNWQLFALLGAAAHSAAFSIYAGRSWLYTLTDSRRALGLTSTTMLVQPVAVLLSGALGGWIVWLGAGKILPALMNAAAGAGDPLLPIRVYVVMAVPVFLAGFVLGLALYSAMASRRTSEEDREWFARAGAWVLALAVGWIVTSGIALLGPSLLVFAWGKAAAVSLGGLSGFVSMWLGGSGHTEAKDDGAPKTWMSRVAEWSLALAAPVFVVLLAILLATGLLALQDYLATTWMRTMLAAAGAIAGACVLVIGLVNWLVNVNVFSLHGMYRDRLIRAYLGASRASRAPHLFTGFDQNDNVSLSHLAPPFFTAEDWPLVHAIAREVGKQPEESAIRTVVEDVDSKLLTDARGIESWSESTVLPVIDRFNAVLVYSKQAASLRQKWEALVRPIPPSATFLPHEWSTVRAVAKALHKALHKSEDADPSAVRLLPFLSGAGLADWPTRVVQAPVWSTTHVTETLKSLNDVIAKVITVGAGGSGRDVSATEVAASLRAQGIPVSPDDLRQRLDRLAPRQKSPFPVVNTALNLVSGEELAWQERQAASFTLTPLHAGSPTVGFRGMVANAAQQHCYGGASGVSLGTAVTISGAAANPNMGYHSSPIVTVLLTLFNARLGAWLGNPSDDKRFPHSCPRNQFFPMALTEAMGLTHAGGGYVHLSDGGHFENLGLYELVRRGCRYILLCDGGCDQDYAFEDLGNAVRKIRIDLGIDIDFEGFRVGPPRTRAAGGPPSDPEPGNYVAIGTIHYEKRADGAKEGKLLYIKPAIFEKQEEPVDVWQYGRLNPAYPHEATSDQWFSESQFESYRALGEYIMKSVAKKAGSQLTAKPATVEQLFEGVEKFLKTGAHAATAAASPNVVKTVTAH
ncbi:MAG TPA: patatin-like phospholipase family protein [Vicinamibacterales bacterium]|nr:patatin-like phospholipase family protein [Vicinamibacterales bacterium]